MATKWTFNVFTGNFDALSDGSSPSTPNFSLEFNSTSDWGVESGGYYTINIPVSTHNKGTSSIIEIFLLDGSNYELVMVDQILVSATGDVSFRVPSSPDLRFAGKIIIN